MSPILYFDEDVPSRAAALGATPSDGAGVLMTGTSTSFFGVALDPPKLRRSRNFFLGLLGLSLLDAELADLFKVAAGSKPSGAGFGL